MGTGAIATGTGATSTLTTTIISTETTTRTLTEVKLARATGGNTTRNTGEMLLTAIEEPQTSSAVRVLAEPVIAAVPEDPVAQVELEALAVPAVQAAQGVLEALAGLEDPVVPAVRAALAALANRVAQVALAVRVAQVALANPVALAALAGRVAQGALELDPVVAVPVLDQAVAERERVPVAVPLKNRSVIAAHHHGRVPAPTRVEDLAAAAAETMREQAATEAAAAWVAAG